MSHLSLESGLPEKARESLQFCAARARDFDDLVVDRAVHLLSEIGGISEWQCVCRVEDVSLFIHVVRIILRVRDDDTSRHFLGEDKIHYLLDHGLTYALVDQVGGRFFVKTLLGSLVYFGTPGRFLRGFFIRALQLTPSAVRKDELRIICLPR